MAFAAIGGAVAGAVVSGAIASISANPLKKAQIEASQIQSRVSQLSTQQTKVLAQQLQKAQSDDEKLKILENSVSSIQVAQVGGEAAVISAQIAAKSQSEMSTALIVLGSAAALVGAAYFLTKE